jgi:hypothetical protein
MAIAQSNGHSASRIKRVIYGGGSFTVNTITFTNQLYVDISVGTFITNIRLWLQFCRNKSLYSRYHRHFARACVLSAAQRMRTKFLNSAARAAGKLWLLIT